MRLIDADALIDELGISDEDIIFEGMLEDAPTIDAVPMERYKSMENTCVKLQKALADVAPVRHGHWIKISPAGIYECSECGKNVMTSDIEAYEYCHGCGARMDAKE